MMMNIRMMIIIIVKISLFFKEKKRSEIVRINKITKNLGN